MFRRNIGPSLLEALADTPVVLLNGARQTGKSTLAQQVTMREHPAPYLSLDDAATLSAARADPPGFLAGIDGSAVIDEIQRAPELFPAIKVVVDRDRQPGTFLLTGSADVLLLPRLSESLAGSTLWPLSQGEIRGVIEGCVDALFAENLPRMPASSESRPTLVRQALIGGYPEAVRRTSEARRRAWFGSYVTTILERDVRDLANIEGLTELPRLLSLLAARAPSLLNFAELSRSSALPQSTLKRYMTLLEATFLLQSLPAWSGNLSRRLVRSPKVLLNDTGLAAYLLGLSEQRLNTDPRLAGPLLENFVVMELRKQASWSHTQPNFFHMRTHTGQEVDIVLEATDGRVVGIEVKASATVGPGDFKALRALAADIGSRFQRGVVMYTGRESLPFGPRLQALPVDALWRLAAQG